MKSMKPLLGLCLLVLLEMITILNPPDILSPFGSAFLYLVLGISTGCVLIKYSKGKNSLLSISVSSATKNISKSWWITVAAGFAVIWVLAKNQFDQVKIIHNQVDKVGSDVIPQIMYFVKRFTSGEFPYKPIPIPEMGYELIPTYLPFQWMPYIPAEIFGFDYRYIALTILSVATFLFLKQLSKISIDKWMRWVLMLIPIVFLINYFPSFYSSSKITVEYNVAAYYLLLCLAIYKRNIWGIGLALLACILSRYSLVLWLPLLGILGWFHLGKTAFFKIIGIIIGGVGLIYLPFFFVDPLLFSKGYHYYAEASIGEWTIKNWQSNKDIYPFHLNQGFGFAYLAFEHFTGTLAEKINAYQKLHLGLSLLTVLSLTIYWWKNKIKWSFEAYALGSFKIYLTVFYSFVVIPYGYLYILPLMVSWVILLLMAKIHYNKTF